MGIITLFTFPSLPAIIALIVILLISCGYFVFVSVIKIGVENKLNKKYHLVKPTLDEVSITHIIEKKGIIEDAKRYCKVEPETRSIYLPSSIVTFYVKMLLRRVVPIYLCGITTLVIATLMNAHPLLLISTGVWFSAYSSLELFCIKLLVNNPGLIVRIATRKEQDE